MHRTDRGVFLTLQKKELGDKYWPRLVKAPGKCGYIRTDFDKWVDEDEQNVRTDDFSSQFGGMDGFDFNGFSGNGDAEDMPKLDDMDSDSDAPSDMDDESREDKKDESPEAGD